MKIFKTKYGRSLLEKDVETIKFIEKHAGLELLSVRHIFMLRDMIKVQVSARFCKGKLDLQFFFFRSQKWG